jgi:hypothetical protein
VQATFVTRHEFTSVGVHVHSGGRIGSELPPSEGAAALMSGSVPASVPGVGSPADPELPEQLHSSTGSHVKPSSPQSDACAQGSM